MKVRADDALKTAHMMALEKQLKTLPDDAPGLRNEAASMIPTLRKELEASAALRADVVSIKPVLASRADDDFESGTLANWRIDRSGAGNWFIYVNGKTPPYPTQSDTFLPFDVPNPPQGKLAAVTDTNGGGRRILSRDITLDGRYRLHLTLFYVNASGFSPTNLLRRDTIDDKQQYRIDLIEPPAPLITTAKDQIIVSIFKVVRAILKSRARGTSRSTCHHGRGRPCGSGWRVPTIAGPCVRASTTSVSNVSQSDPAHVGRWPTTGSRRFCGGRFCVLSGIS